MTKKNACDYENAVVESLKSGIANNEISAHLQSCADCRETWRVVNFFQTNLTNEPSPGRLPAAGLIFWKARLREKQRAAERVGQPIFIANIIAAMLVGGVFVWLSGNDDLPFSTLGAAFERVAESMAQFVFPMIGGLLGFALVSFITVLLMRRLLPEK